MRDDNVVSLVIAVAAGFVAGAGITMGVCKRKEITAELSSEFHGAVSYTHLTLPTIYSV